MRLQKYSEFICALNFMVCTAKKGSGAESEIVILLNKDVTISILTKLNIYLS